jgi:hypothetical protein
MSHRHDHRHGAETKATLLVVLLFIAFVSAIIESHREEIEAFHTHSSH